MKTQHIQGPYHVGMRNGHNANFIYAYDGNHPDGHDDTVICSVFGLPQHTAVQDIEPRYTEGLATANLLSASDEMFALLFELREGGSLNGTPEMLARVDAVIAKVMGAGR